jgi:hypothetical protein
MFFSPLFNIHENLMSFLTLSLTAIYSSITTIVKRIKSGALNFPVLRLNSVTISLFSPFNINSDLRFFFFDNIYYTSSAMFHLVLQNNHFCFEFLKQHFNVVWQLFSQKPWIHTSLIAEFINNAPINNLVFL